MDPKDDIVNEIEYTREAEGVECNECAVGYDSEALVLEAEGAESDDIADESDEKAAGKNLERY